MSTITYNTSTTIEGILIGKNGFIRAIEITSSQFRDVVCHTVSGHDVSHEGGFYGGEGSITAEGAAIGKHATTLDFNSVPINAVQIGQGNNPNKKTVKFYGYELLKADGTINPDRIPDSSGSGVGSSTLRRLEVVSSNEVLVSPNRLSYIVDSRNNNVILILPQVQEVEHRIFHFRLGYQDHGYAMTIERSGLDVIIVDGEEWLGITSNDLGFWVSLMAKDGKWYVILDSGIDPNNNI